MAGADKELWVRIRANASELETALKKSGAAFDAFGRRLTGIGRQMTVSITAPLVAMAAAVTRAQLGAEDAFTEMAKTVDAPVARLEQLRERFEQLSEDVIPKTANELTRLAALGGQLGITTDALDEFVQTVAALDISTDLGAEDAATGLAQFANVMGTSQADLDRLGSTIVDLGNNLATTESRILEMGLRLAGAGRQAGLSEAEVLSFAGALSSMGLEAQAGGTSISKVFAEMAKSVAEGDANLSRFAAVAGMSVSSFAQLFRDDASRAVLTFIQGLRRLSDQGANVFGVLDSLGLSERRVTDALLRSAGSVEVLEGALERGSTAWEENTALTEEARKFYERAGADLKRFWNEIVNTAGKMGKELIPAMRATLDVGRVLIDRVVRPMVETFARLPQWLQLTVIGFAGLAAAIGPVLIVTGQLIQSLVALRRVVTLLAGARGLAGLAALLTPAGALIAGAVALGVGLGVLAVRGDRATREMRKLREELDEVKASLGGLNDEQLRAQAVQNTAAIREAGLELQGKRQRLEELQSGPPIFRSPLGGGRGAMATLEREIAGLEERIRLLLESNTGISEEFLNRGALAKLGGLATGGDDGLEERIRLLLEGILGGGGGGGDEVPFATRRMIEELDAFAQASARAAAQMREGTGPALEDLVGDLGFAAAASSQYNEGIAEIDETQRRSIRTHVELASDAEHLREVLAALDFSRVAAQLEALERQLIESFGAITADVVSGTKSLLEGLASALKAALLNSLQKLDVQGKGGDLTAFATGFIRALPFAEGGTFGRGTLALVGERGPELVGFGAAGRVFPNDQLGGMLAGGGTRREVHQTLEFNMQAVDRRGVAELIMEHSGLIAQIARQTEREGN